MAAPDRPCVFASDLRNPAVRLLGSQLSTCGLSDIVSTACLDFMDLNPDVIYKKLAERGSGEFEPGLIVLNPPYGLRLGSLSESRSLFGAILEKLWKDFRGWRAAVIVPGKLVGKRTAKSFRRTSLFHGGLDLALLTGEITAKR